MEDIKYLSVRINPELHKNIKRICWEKDLKMYSLITLLLEEALKNISGKKNK